MGKTKKDAQSKKKNHAPEATESNGEPVIPPSPTHEEIQRRAYEIYLSQGAAAGRDLDNWLQAERDLRQANGGTASAMA